MGEFLVIKCGGSVFEKLPTTFYKNIVELKKGGKVHPVIVHGGGPMITALLEQLQIQTQFHQGLRVTTNDVLEIVEMVLTGSVNKKVVSKLTELGGKAIGLSGVDGKLLQAEAVQETELGFVGEVKEVNHKLIQDLSALGYIPVISPIAIGENSQHYNVNGDTAAAALAKSLKAKLCLISDVPGILIEKQGKKELLHQASKQQVESLIKSEVIYGGMVPKVKAALDCLEHQVPEVVILSGLTENSLIDFTQGKAVGTKMMLEESAYAN